ncbi:MAG: hypothetical protein E7419_05130 [Ruminococcaceae bacterium]|nr:hypothetical protein [Oscillospiraceae bacterium]
MNNLNDDIVRKAKEKINSMLSEKQKEELLKKVSQMDKNSIKSIFNTINPDKVEDPDLRAFIKNFKGE